MKKFLFALTLLASSPAVAQWQTPAGTIPVGRGPGVSGFTTVAGSAGIGTRCLMDTTPPTFTTCGGSATTTCNVGTGYYASIAAAFTACPTKATILVLEDQTVSSSIVTSGANLRLTCKPGVLINVGVGPRFEINGANFEVDHCQFVGPGSGIANRGQLFLFFAGGGQFNNNIVSGFGATGPTPGGNGIIEWVGPASSIKGQNNTFTGNNDFDMSVQGSGSDDILFTGNKMSDLLVFGGTADSISNVRITDNYFTAGGFASGQSICAFIANITNLTFTGNTCQHIANVVAGVGGTYSFAQISNFTIAGNTYVTNGFLYEDYSFEYNHMRNGTITGNYANNSSGTSTHGQGMICESCQNISFTGNTQLNWKGSFSGFIFVETNTVPSFSIQTDLTITGNVAKAGFNGATITGITVSNQSATPFPGGNITISGNDIGGSGFPIGSNGIVVDGGAGGISNVLVGPNTIVNVGSGVVIGALVTAFCVLTGANYATTPRVGAGASACN